MDAVSQQLRQLLRDRGQSLTAPRLTVFTALRGREPQTMHQLVEACGGVDRASVYRTIALLEQLGIVQRLQIGWKYKLELTDAFSHHHHHLTCLKCGRVISFDETEALAQELRAIGQVEDFTIQTHQLELQGLCEACKPKDPERSAPGSIRKPHTS
jgi:Fur family ferric uptake transcriptional regulator